MSTQSDNDRLDELIFRTINTEKPQFDAEKWKEKYPNEYQTLISRRAKAASSRQPNILRVIFGKPVTQLAAAAAAAVIVASIICFHFLEPAADVGRIRNLYGIVTLKDGGLSEDVTENANIRPGQWINVLSGSKAEILLKDKSRILPEPRTVFQVNDRKNGLEILLARGAMAIQAAKQAPGKSLTIKADGSQIKILGTSLDVRLVKKPDGTKQTRVSVSSGSVELESSGEKIVLPPNTEGIVDQGERPVRQSINLEANEMLRLFNKNNDLAAQSNVQAGLPAIIDYIGGSSATIWTIVPWEKLEPAGTGQYSLKLKYQTLEAEAFTLDGMELNVSGKDNMLHIDCPDVFRKSALLTHVILKIPNIQELFQAEQENAFQFDLPADNSGVVTLFQFRLPRSAYICEVSPAPIERQEKLNRIVVTIAANSRMAEICY